MTRTLLIPFLALALFAVSGFTTSQPEDERAAQSELPQSKDGMWEILGKSDVKFEDKSGLFTATIDPDVKALNGTVVKVSGFMLPLEAEETFKHFLLSKRTPTCAFCPPGEPDEIVEVFSTEPTEWDDGLVTYEGTFELISNRETGLFYRLNEADKK